MAKRYYTARAVEAELGFASTGTEQVAILFEVAETGQQLTWYGYFTEKSEARTIESLRHAGWLGDDLADLSTVGSQECQIVIDDETYQGQTREKVIFVNALGSGGGGGGIALKTVMTPEEKRAFATRMKGTVIAGNGGKASAPAARTAPAPRPAARPAPVQRPAAAAPSEGAPDGGAGDIPF